MFCIGGPESCDDENNDLIIGNTEYSPAPLPSTAAQARRMVKALRVISGCFVRFFRIGLSVALLNSKIV
jgi:hypothetical protein